MTNNWVTVIVELYVPYLLCPAHLCLFVKSLAQCYLFFAYALSFTTASHLLQSNYM